MSKGRRVPPRQETQEEIDQDIRRLIGIGRQAERHARQMIDDHYDLNREALNEYDRIWRKTYEHRTGLPAGTLEAAPMFYTYILESNGIYKIGVTQDIPKRIKSLQVGNPHPIRLLDYMISSAGPSCEHQIHLHFRHRRVSGEWFALNEADITTIRGWFKDGIPTYLGT
jgi:hypothetical protein